MQNESADEERILVLAPRGRDARVVEQVLMRGGVHCTICSDYRTMVHEMYRPTGAALLVEEALHGADITLLTGWLSQQPSWSDFPFVVLLSQQTGHDNHGTQAILKNLGNVVLLERPINAETLRSAAASALRARRRQYQARRDLEEHTRSEERLRIALQAGRLGKWELDLASHSFFGSKKFLEDLRVEEGAPFGYEDLIAAIHPDDRDRQLRVVDAALANASEFDIEYRVFWPDGTMRWFHVQGTVDCDAEGQPARLIGVSQDITERRDAEIRLHESQEALLHLNATLESRIAERTAELAQANDRLMREMTERERAQMALVQNQKMEALGHLTSGISHDFNNLLSVIQGNADLVYFLSEDDRLKRMASTIRKAAQQGAKLTGQLLAFSRGQRLDLKAIDLNKALEGVKDLLSASLGSGTAVKFELASNLPNVRADLNQIELAVLNLAINAKDAMREGGTVTIRTSVSPASANLPLHQDYVVISVIDTGEGINPEIIAKVFDPFFTTKPLGKGTGLGLSQVYGIAQQSGGTAKIKSQVGAGTTVEVWLPIAEPAEVASASPVSGIGTSAGSKRMRILVVEDDPRVRQFIVECLEILGYQVVQAEHGQAGLDALSIARPDLLITDFLMPGMTGAEFIHRAHKVFPGLPAIIATGYADMRAIAEVIDIEMVLPKPFQLNDLAHRVEHALTLVEPASRLRQGE